MRKLSLSLTLLSAMLCAASLSTLHAAPISLTRPAEGQVSGLLAYYKLDQTSGSTVSDATNSYNGDLQAGVGTLPTWSSQGHFGGALRFNNPTFSNATKQGHILTAPATGDINLIDTDFTIGLWFKLNELPTTAMAQNIWLLDKKGGSTSANGWAVSLERNANGDWALYMRGANTVSYSPRFSDINDMDWHHIGIMFDNDTDQVYFSLDGVILPPTTSAIPFSGVSAGNNAALMIGQRNGTGANIGSNADFSIDDLFISNEKHSFAIPESSSYTICIALVTLGACIALRRRFK